MAGIPHEGFELITCYLETADREGLRNDDLALRTFVVFGGARFDLGLARPHHEVARTNHHHVGTAVAIPEDALADEGALLLNCQPALSFDFGLPLQFSEPPYFLRLDFGLSLEVGLMPGFRFLARHRLTLTLAGDFAGLCKPVAPV